MAIVVAGNTAIDTNNTEIGALVEGDAVAATASYIRLLTGLWVDEFYGAFQYDLFGDLAGGRLTGWKQMYNGHVVFDLSQISVEVPTFLNWVAQDDNLGAVTSILSGSDSISGSAFGDILSGWAGADTIQAGGGWDTVFGGLGNDSIGDASGQNFLRGEDGDDYIQGGADFDDAHGNMGNDTVRGGDGDDWVVGGKDEDLLYGEKGWDVVWGNLGNDTQYGDDGNDQVRGGQGDDIVHGGAGDDYVSGDRGNDTITGGTGADRFHGSQDIGIDRVLDFNRLEGDRVLLDPGTTYTVRQEGADTIIDMGGGHQMILVGVQQAALSDGWIVSAWA